MMAASLMQVDDESREEGEKTKEKKKEKGKEGAAWEIVGGSGRCSTCQKEDTECRINLAVIKKWQEDIKAGKKFSKAPTGTSCKRCASIRRKSCLLPASLKCRKKLKAKVSAAPSASSGEKRQQMQVEVELPPRKKRREKSKEGMSEGEFWAAAVAVLERIEGQMRQLAAELGRHAKAAELSNVLLQCLVSVRKGGMLVGGEVPPEGGLETESEAGGLEYETDELEEGTEEEEKEKEEEGN